MPENEPASLEDLALCTELLEIAVQHGLRFLDSPDVSPPDSLVGALREVVSTDPTWDWPDGLPKFVEEAITALMGTASLHLDGIAKLLAGSPPVYLHPLSALIRSVGEACGSLFWHLEPWLDERNPEFATFEISEFKRRSEQVMVRAELRFVTELHSRRRRIGAREGETSEAWRKADQALKQHQDYLQRRFDRTKPGGEPTTQLSGRVATWTVKGERIPTYSELLHSAVELGHGQPYLGKMGNNIYNLLSGFSHPSIELFHGHVPRGDEVPSNRLRCSHDELLGLVGTVGRAFAAAFDMATSITGYEAKGFAEWESEFDRQVALA